MSDTTRRAFLKYSVVGVPILFLVGKVQRLLAGEFEHGAVNFWSDNSFTQPNVNMEEYGKRIIKAKVNGRWQEYRIRELPQEFMHWNLQSRLQGLERMRKGEMSAFAGPHFAAVASYGGGRLDSDFTVNNAVKGVGFVPKGEKIREIIMRLEETKQADHAERYRTLESIYREGQSLDSTKQVSLELYTDRDFETHTFLNIMSNPSVSIVFLDMPSYEVRAVARLIHPDDRTASQEEKNIAEYVNTVHDYIHGAAPRKSIAMIFHVIEVFDNSPRMRGVRLVP